MWVGWRVWVVCGFEWYKKHTICLCLDGWSCEELGALQQLGHVDFYPGKGTVQQGCKFEVL